MTSLCHVAARGGLSYPTFFICAAWVKGTQPCRSRFKDISSTLARPKETTTSPTLGTKCTSWKSGFWLIGPPAGPWLGEAPHSSPAGSCSVAALQPPYAPSSSWRFGGGEGHQTFRALPGLTDAMPCHVINGGDHDAHNLALESFWEEAMFWTAS